MRKTENQKIIAIAAKSSVVISQATSSIATFLLNFYLLYMTAPKEFGLFGISFAIVMFVNGFWQGYFVTQYIVLSPDEDAARFPSQVYATMATITIVITTLLLGVAAFLELLSGIGLLVVGIILSATAYSFKEFFVRHSFSVGRGWSAVLINAFLVVNLASFFGLCWIFEVALKADTALLGFAIALGATALLGHFLSELTLLGHSREEIFQTLGKLGVGGRWAAATNIVYAVRNNAHVIILSGTIGPLAVAQVNAARLFLTPAILLIPAASNVFLPEFSQAFSAGGRAVLRRSQRRSAAILTVVILTYIAFLLLPWRYLEPLLVGEQYAGLFPLIAAWSAFAAIRALRSIVDWGAQAEKRFALIAKISCVAAIVALIAVLILTETLGLNGAVIALILAEITMIAALGLALRRDSSCKQM